MSKFTPCNSPQKNKIKSLKDGLIKFDKFLKKECKTAQKYLWNKIYTWADNNLEDECLEYIVSMMMEPYDDIVDPLINNMISFPQYNDI